MLVFEFGIQRFGFVSDFGFEILNLKHEAITGAL